MELTLLALTCSSTLAKSTRMFRGLMWWPDRIGLRFSILIFGSGVRSSARSAGSAGFLGPGGPFLGRGGGWVVHQPGCRRANAVVSRSARVRGQQGAGGFGGPAGQRSKTAAVAGVWVPSAALDAHRRPASAAKPSVHRELHQGAPDPVLVEYVQGQVVARPVSLAKRMRPSQRARRRWRTSRSGSCPRQVLGLSQSWV